MKVLHTADWHLGKKLEQSDRHQEHLDFLDWLAATIENECIDVLIIAGDIFDTTAPSNTALEMYFDFLGKIKNTCCKNIIVIGGNHDSASTLDAPKRLLKFFNIHVVGGVPENRTEQLINIKDGTGQTRLIVCAVPFLRDRDIRLSVPGETASEREQRIKQGIASHYQALVEHILPYKAEGIPIIATGHLFAVGASTSDSEKEIHVGNLGQVAATQFPSEFDYIALGHLHRPQIVGKLSHIRYSGSPLPLSFSEHKDEKKVIVISFDTSQTAVIKELAIPQSRPLIRISGCASTVKTKIQLLENMGSKYPAWVEVQVETDQYVPELEEQLNRIKTEKPFIERFFIRQIRSKPIWSLEKHVEEHITLEEMDPKTVFSKKCQSAYPDIDHAELIETFGEVLELLDQEEE